MYDKFAVFMFLLGKLLTQLYRNISLRYEIIDNYLRVFYRMNISVLRLWSIVCRYFVTCCSGKLATKFAFLIVLCSIREFQEYDVTCIVLFTVTGCGYVVKMVMKEKLVPYQKTLLLMISLHICKHLTNMCYYWELYQ